MNDKAKLWPEGELFTREVVIQTGLGPSEEGVEPAGYEDFPVMVTFIVPPFDVVVETWRNTDPAKSFGLFRQFIVGWDQEEVLSDKVLMGFLYAYPGTDEALFKSWTEYMKSRLACSEHQFTMISLALN
ncbi:TPA: hypothetical protein U2L65_004665 [Citrobacter farmeri]|uniref:Uncharacterized protein n=1 Tax=Citrobacter farmeri TaxID=67824 RepID=A0ACA8D5R4_9ENTR|nr:hypothetical protein [Citrobacter farmeri]AST79605.1 hypothetical protein CI104_11255 [Citrobacter farmeri]HAT2752558.1 hypothetical protein [Citrobacter farmeri]HBI2995803.1 hypothetical protein [Citrobacter farmeri]HBI3000918.1 hypothetical protein [Citrobacter farmeri]HBI3006912.1 hypothetical protein [Citrobacter farmeri]